MIVSQIVAIGSENQIGCKNKLLWHIPEDFKQFKKRTMGHHILMGRKTFESIGKILPGRVTIVVSKSEPAKHIDNKDLFFVKDIESGIELARERGESELFICGGESIYRQSLSIAEKIYLTKVEFHGEADTFFPTLQDKEWKILSTEHHQAVDNILSWSLEILQKKG